MTSVLSCIWFHDSFSWWALFIPALFSTRWFVIRIYWNNVNRQSFSKPSLSSSESSPCTTHLLVSVRIRKWSGEPWSPAKSSGPAARLLLSLRKDLVFTRRYSPFFILINLAGNVSSTLHFPRNNGTLSRRVLSYIICVISADFNGFSKLVWNTISRQFKDTLLRPAQSAGRVKKKVAPNPTKIFGSAKEGLYFPYFSFVSQIMEISCWFRSFKITLKR